MRQYSRENYLKNREKISKKMHEYYLKNKEAINDRINKYHKQSKSYQDWHKDYYVNDWYPSNKTKMKKLMKKQYLKHPDRFMSRAAIHNLNLQILLIKECKQCKTKDNLQIHHEKYPSKKAEIIKAIQQGYIYHLCKDCHSNLRLL